MTVIFIMQMTTTEAPRNHVHDGRVMASSGTRLSTSCDGAILSCCKPSDTRNMQLQCLAKFGCLHAFSGGAACDPQSIQNIMKSLNREYSTHNGWANTSINFNCNVIGISISVLVCCSVCGLKEIFVPCEIKSYLKITVLSR